MRARDVARDRQSEARATFVLVPRLVETVERPEDVVPMLGGDAGTVVVDVDPDESLLPDGRDLDAVGVALGVGDEVADAALDRQRPHPDVELAAGLDLDRRAEPFGLRLHVLEQRPEIDRGGRLAGASTLMRGIVRSWCGVKQTTRLVPASERATINPSSSTAAAGTLGSSAGKSLSKTKVDL